MLEVLRQDLLATQQIFPSMIMLCSRNYCSGHLGAAITSMSRNLYRNPPANQSHVQGWGK